MFKEIECLSCGECASFAGTPEEVEAMASEFRKDHRHEPSA